MLTEVVKRYQHFNPETGRFDAPRTLREYGRLIGVDHSTLSILFNSDREPSTFVLGQLSRTFPAASNEIATALRAQPEAIPA